MAAAEGQTSCVELLMTLPECSVLCKASGYLVQLACQILKLLPACIQRTDQLLILDKWRCCLNLIESPSIENHPFTALYDNHKEFTCLTEMIQAMENNTFFQIEIYFQCLLILERCLGLYFMSPSNKSLNMFSWLSGVALRLITTNIDTRIIQLLLNRSIQAFSVVYEQNKTGLTSIHHQYWCQTLLLLNDKSHYNVFLALQLQRRCSINHIDFLESMMMTFNEITLFSDGMYLKNDSLQTSLKRIFYVITTWYKECDHAAFPKELANFCNVFMEKYFIYPFGSTLLHSFLQYIALCNDHTFSTNLLEEFLLCGGYRGINSLDANGRRPGHFILELNIPIDLKMKFLSKLEQYGAHLDSVDKNGRTILDSMDKRLKSVFCRKPLSLLCCCSRIIVSEQLVYETHFVPKHVIKLIQLHDSSAN